MDMKVAALNINTQILFKGNEPHFSAYDDEISQARREYIREHYESWHMPYQSIYEKEGRLEEYNLNKVIANLTNRHKSFASSLQNISDNNRLDYKLLETLTTMNNEPIGETNSYRGSTLAENIDDLKIAKEAGIKCVVDLEGYPNLAEDCKREGLEYFDFSVIDKFWLSHACKDKETIINRSFNFWRNIQGKNDDVVQENIKADLKIWRENKNNFISDLIKFINIMNRDNVYIGCLYGTDRTDNALMLNHFFNPKAYDRTPDCVTRINRGALEKLEVLYRNLSTINKKDLGWTKEFESKFLPRLENAIQNSRYLKW